MIKFLRLNTPFWNEFKHLRGKPCILQGKKQQLKSKILRNFQAQNNHKNKKCLRHNFGNPNLHFLIIKNLYGVQMTPSVILQLPQNLVCRMRQRCVSRIDTLFIHDIHYDFLIICRSPDTPISQLWGRGVMSQLNQCSEVMENSWLSLIYPNIH